MKTLRRSIFLPVFALIVFLGFGAGTVLANSNNEGMGSWNPIAVGAGQINSGAPSDLSGIDGSDDARLTSQATGSEPKRRAFVGTLDGIMGVDVSSITVNLQTSGGGDSQDIGLPGDPLVVSAEGTVTSDFIRTPGGPRAGTATDGARVVVLAERNEAGAWTVLWMLVKPLKPEVPLNGVVVAADGAEVTVETPNGDTEIVTLPEGAGEVTPGEVITVFRGHSRHARGLVRAAEVKHRLKKFLDHAEEEVDQPEEVADGRGNKHDRAAARAERIAKFLERFSERQTRMLDRAIDRAPEKARERLARARKRIHSRRVLRFLASYSGKTIRNPSVEFWPSLIGNIQTACIVAGQRRSMTIDRITPTEHAAKALTGRDRITPTEHAAKALTGRDRITPTEHAAKALTGRDQITPTEDAPKALTGHDRISMIEKAPRARTSSDRIMSTQNRSASILPPLMVPAAVGDGGKAAARTSHRQGRGCR